MGRPKKIKSEEPKGSPENPMTRAEAVELMGEEEVSRIEATAITINVITPLSLDYPSEGLNDMARKINEIITFLNG